MLRLIDIFNVVWFL